LLSNDYLANDERTVHVTPRVLQELRSAFVFARRPNDLAGLKPLLLAQLDSATLQWN
jgi:hypothetical protein